VPDEKPAHDKALELFVYAPVGVALYVRDMLPTMMTVFVSRGKREVQSHLPGQPPPPPTPPSPADVRRRVEESLGLARVVTESGIGVAKGMAGTGFGLARGLADTAAQGLGAVQGSWVPGGGGSSPGGSGARTDSGPVADAPASSTSPSPPSADAPATPSPAPAPPGGPSTADATANGTPVAASPDALSTDDAGTAGPVPDVGSLAIPDYDELSASQVVERLEGLDDESLDAIRRYEAAHRGRNTILGKIAQLG
jgi:hypothetical protein